MLYWVPQILYRILLMGLGSVLLTPTLWNKLSFHHFMVFPGPGSVSLLLTSNQEEQTRAPSRFGGQHLQWVRRGSPLSLPGETRELGPLVVNVTSQMPAAPLGLKLCEVGSLQRREPLPPGQACMSPERRGEGCWPGQRQSSERLQRVMGRAASRRRRSQA